MKEAMFYTQNEDGVQCQLCPKNCAIESSGVGMCGVRGEYNGKLYALSYAKLSAVQVDPVEKKPLAMFMPNTETFSVGSFGCNMDCPYCQNYAISQSMASGADVTPQQMVAQCTLSGCNSISYTYNEPTTQYEFVYEAAQLAKEKGISNILVTNGYINRQPLLKLLPFIDAVNVDIKSSREDVYESVLRGSLKAALNTVREAALSCHVEVTALMAPQICDVGDVLLVAQMLREIDPAIPLHITRYHPCYKFTKPATSIDTMNEAEKVARTCLENVFLGNI